MFKFFYDEDMNVCKKQELHSTINIPKQIQTLDFKSLECTTSNEIEKLPKNNIQLLLFYLDVGNVYLFKEYYYLCDYKTLLINCHGNQNLQERIENISINIEKYVSLYITDVSQEYSIKSLKLQLSYIKDIYSKRVAIVCFFNKILILNNKELLVEFINYIINNMILSPLQEKFIFVSIYEYYLENDTLFLKNKEFYDMLIYLLATNNSNYYKEGIYKYTKLMGSLDNISIMH